MNDDRRRDTHRQMLVDVGIVVARGHGEAYAEKFMVDMNISPSVIERVLSRSPVRPLLHKLPAPLPAGSAGAVPSKLATQP